MVDGTVYYDEEKDAKMKEDIDNDRVRIISGILKESSTTSSPNFQNMPRR